MRVLTIRDKVEYIVKEYGVKKNFITRKIGVTQSDFSLFMCGDKELKKEYVNKFGDVFKKYNGLPFEV